jgi:hypothetical protein
MGLVVNMYKVITSSIGSFEEPTQEVIEELAGFIVNESVFKYPIRTFNKDTAYAVGYNTSYAGRFLKYKLGNPSNDVHLNNMLKNPRHLQNLDKTFPPLMACYGVKYVSIDSLNESALAVLTTEPMNAGNFQFMEDGLKQRVYFRRSRENQVMCIDNAEQRRFLLK